MELEVTGSFIYFTLPIFGGINVTQTMVSSFIVTALLCCVKRHHSCDIIHRHYTHSPCSFRIL